MVFIQTFLYFSKTLSEKTKELEKLHSEWMSQSSSVSNRHSQELRSEREKAVEVRVHLSSIGLLENLKPVKVEPFPIEDTYTVVLNINLFYI